MMQAKYNIKLIALFVVLILSILLSACGGGSKGEDIQISEIIIFVPDGHKSPLIDQTFQLSAVGIYSNTGVNEEITSKVRWQSNNPDVASVSSTGEVTTFIAGDVIISAIYADISHGVKLTVNPPPSVESVSILALDNGYIVDEGESITLTAESILSSEATSLDNELYNWTSSDTEIATVDESGVVFGESTGQATITITAKDNENITEEITVTVKAKLIGISVSSELTYVELGEASKLIVYEELSDGSSIPIPTLVRWFYDVPDTVRITASGDIKTTRTGTVNATAIYGDFELTQQIIVEEPIELFVVEDTGGFIKLAWREKHNANAYTLHWNNTGGSKKDDNIVEFDADTLEYVQSDVDTNKPYYYRLTFTRKFETPINIKQEADETNSTNTLTWNASCDATEYTLYLNNEEDEPKVIEIKIPTVEISDCDTPPELTYTHENYDASKSYDYRLTYTYLGNESAPSQETKVWAHIGDWQFRNVNEPRAFAAGASYNENMYLFGGELTIPADPKVTGSEPTKKITNEAWEYNILKNTWTIIDSLQSPLRNATACANNEFIYVIGGEDENKTVVDTIHLYNATQSKWTYNVATLPVALSNVGCNIVNDMLYISGGYNGTKAVDSMYRYDIALKTWNVDPLPSLNTARYNHASIVLDDKIYIAGGNTLTDPATRQIESFDLLSDTPSWVSLKNMASSRSSFALISWDGQLHAIGGRDINNNIINSVETYNPVEDDWLSASTMPFPNTAFNFTLYDSAVYIFGGTKNTPESSHEYSDYMKYALNDGSWLHGINPDAAKERFSSAMINEKLYVLGGSDFTGASTDIRSYNTQDNSWEKLNSLKDQRHGASSVSYSTDTVQRIYTFGGINNTHLTSAEVYDLELNDSELIESMSIGRNFAAAAVLGLNIYVFGGEGDQQVVIESDQASNTFEVFNISRNTWIKVGTLPHKRSHATAIALNNKIYLIGGFVGEQSDKKASNTIDIYTPATDTWEEGSTLNIARTSPGSAMLNNKIYVFGGLDVNNDPIKSVESLTPFTISPEAKALWAKEDDLPRNSNTAVGGTFENKIYLISQEGRASSSLSNNIFVFE